MQFGPVSAPFTGWHRNPVPVKTRIDFHTPGIWLIAPVFGIEKWSECHIADVKIPGGHRIALIEFCNLAGKSDRFKNMRIKQTALAVIF